jgi:hypothetical protein
MDVLRQEVERMEKLLRDLLKLENSKKAKGGR